MPDDTSAPSPEKDSHVAPAAHDEAASATPATPARASLPNSVLVLGFCAIALLGVLIALTLKPSGKSGAAGPDDDLAVRDLKARIQLQRENLNAEAAKLNLPPLYGSDTTQSAEAVAERITNDAATLVSLSKGVKDLIAGKDAELATRTREWTEAVKLQTILRGQLAEAEKSRDRALIEGSEASSLRQRLEDANRRGAALSDEVRRLGNGPADLQKRVDDLTRERDLLAAQLKDLRAQFSRASLFAGTESQILREAVELYRSLQKLENQPDSEVARAYSQFGANLGATVLDKLDFDTGSAEVKAALIEKVRQFAADAPSNALLFVVGYASETGNVDDNRVLSSDRATAVARLLDDAKQPGQRVQAAYLGQTDRFGSKFPERNQICEVWQIVPKN